MPPVPPRQMPVAPGQWPPAAWSQPGIGAIRGESMDPVEPMYMIPAPAAPMPAQAPVVQAPPVGPVMRLRQQQLAAAAPPIVTNGGWPRLADDIRSMDARQPLVLARLAPQPPPSSNETSKKTEHDIMIERLAAQPQFVAMGNK